MAKHSRVFWADISNKPNDKQLQMNMTAKPVRNRLCSERKTSAPNTINETSLIVFFCILSYLNFWWEIRGKKHQISLFSLEELHFSREMAVGLGITELVRLRRIITMWENSWINKMNFDSCCFYCNYNRVCKYFISYSKWQLLIVYIERGKIMVNYNK